MFYIQQLRKLIFWTAIILVVILIILPIMIHVLRLEFTNNDEELAYDNFTFIGLPVLIVLTLTGTLKRNDTAVNAISKIGITLFIALNPILIIFSTALDGMCKWTTDKDLFENRNDQSIRIVRRGLGCGATDSGGLVFDIFKTENYTSHFIRVSKFDTLNINKTEWRLIAHKENGM